VSITVPQPPQGGAIPETMQPQGMPNMGVPLINIDRTVAYAWYRFFTSIFATLLSNKPDSVSSQLTDTHAQIADLQNQIKALQDRLAAARIP
jgi:hypothetical protein